MKKLTMRIFIVVFIAALFSTVGLFFISSALTTVTDDYSELCEVYYSRKNLIESIGKNIYSVQSLVSMHLLSDDSEKQTDYNRRIDSICEETEAALTELGKNTDGAMKEIVHTTSADFYGFTDCIDVITSLSEKDCMETALYYYYNHLQDYINDMNAELTTLTDTITVTLNEKEADIDDFTGFINTIKIVFIAASLIVEAVCVIVVFKSGVMIETVQSEEKRNHQLAYIELQNNVISGMANIIESRDGDTGEHVLRTSAFVKMIAEELKKENAYPEILTDSYTEDLVKAAPLHDIGKIRIPDSILLKKGKLTVEEFEEMKQHSALGGQIVRDILGNIEEKQYVEVAYNIAAHHHEKWDGSGYPDSLSGDKIPLEARIMAVADVFDALISKRCYKEPISVDDAYKIIEDSSGSHFDPKVAGAFIAAKERVIRYVRSGAQ